MIHGAVAAGKQVQIDQLLGQSQQVTADAGRQKFMQSLLNSCAQAGIPHQVSLVSHTASVDYTGALLWMCLTFL